MARIFKYDFQAVGDCGMLIIDTTAEFGLVSYAGVKLVVVVISAIDFAGDGINPA